MLMEQLYNNADFSIRESKWSVFKDKGAQRQKHFGMQRSHSRLKAVDDINPTQIHKLECLVTTKRFIYSHQTDKRKENTTSK